LQLVHIPILLAIDGFALFSITLRCWTMARWRHRRRVAHEHSLFHEVRSAFTLMWNAAYSLAQLYTARH